MVGYERYLQEKYDQHLDDLIAFLRIPSVSALSEHKNDVAAAARWLADYLSGIGLDHAQVMPTAHHPVVYADWLHKPGAPTALIYGHYDVQPVDPVHLWESAPFAPAVRDGRLYARGASDDKGQVMAHIQALEALLKSERDLPVNVKLLIEGEEEIGSPSLGPFLQAHSDLIAADVVVISDTSMFADGLPTICCGLRGVAGLEAHVTTAKTDLHSGLYGGAVANPIHVLAELLASMREGQGRIAVPGFYDAVVELTPSERAQSAGLPFDEEAFTRGLGVPGLAGESDYTPLERMTTRPTLEVNGIWGGFQGEGTKTVIPSEAHAKITCRLVPDQDPHEIQQLLSRHLTANCPPSAHVEVDLGHVAKPWTCQPDTPAVQAAVRALRRTFDSEVALTRVGGSIPVVETLDALLHVPCVLIGFAAPDSNAHAPNESFPVETFRMARRAICAYWRELAQA